MDCGPVNPLTELKNQFNQDRFQDNENLRRPQQGFRDAPPSAISRQHELADEFLRASAPPSSSSASALPHHHPHVDHAFKFHDLHQQLNHVAPSNFPDTVPQTDWNSEFAQFHSARSQQSLGPAELHQFDQAFQAARDAHHSQAAAPWASEFQQFQNSSMPPVHISEDVSAALDRAFENARSKDWAPEFSKHQPAELSESWVKEFNATEASDLSKSAGDLINVMGEKMNDPKFSNSEFMKFMSQLRDQEVTVEGNDLVQDPGNWAAEFTNKSGQFVENMWSKEFGEQYMGNEKDWSEDFESANQLHHSTWANEFDRLSAQDPALRAWNANIPEYGQYQFEPLNPFVHESPEMLAGLTFDAMPLADAILALEARLTHDPSDAQSWSLLGIKQQENERERQAISALRRAAELAPTLLEPWLALAVSYTNENHPEPAYDSLRQWIHHHPKYHSIGARATTTNDSFQEVSRMFLEATQINPSELDADVQVGLGVLFNVSEEYDKAVDCFQAALAIRPNDYLLWNKLGATLANSRDAPRAMDAYFRALDINPSYIRARYNLAIASINLGQHREAAHHLIEALSVQLNTPAAAHQDSSVTPGFMSSNVWDTLRMACLLMNKADWATLCDGRDLATLRSAFDQE